MVFLLLINISLLALSGAKNVINIIEIAYSAISKSSKAVPDTEIVKLSKMSDGIKGTKKVNKYIGNLNLPQNLREDLYLRIAIHQKKISQDEAKSMFANLKGKEGFSSTLSKVIGNNPQGTKGHLNELKIANKASQSSFEVIAIGKKFDDGMKNSLTDIDILLRKNGKDILIEAKDYSVNTKMSIDKFKADLDTLLAYGENVSKGKSLKIFSFTNEPDNAKILKQYQTWADQKGVQLIFGTPAQQIEQIKMLERLL